MTLPRRGFLAVAGVAGVAGVGLTAAGPVSAVSTAAGSAAPVPVLRGPFPRALAFRQAEVLANLRGYAEWSAGFAPLGGFVAKLLTEERTDTVTATNARYADRYAREHPDALVVLHYNGRARRPGYRTAGWSASDWLTRAGTATTAPIAPDTTAVGVADPGVFALVADLQGALEVDVVLTGRASDGRPDWTVAEYAVLSAIDAAAGRVTLRRGAYGSAAAAFAAGAYVAQLVSAGPWSAQDTRLWLYNLATTAVRGPDGRSVADRIVAEFAADTARGGPLARIDGVELDVFAVGDDVRPFLDADGDGAADAAISGGVDRYREGQAVLTQGLRAVLGASRPLAVDSGLQRPDPGSVCGIEIEGFPGLTDPGARGWSEGVASLARWTAGGGAPRLSYPLAKTRVPADVALQARRFRLTLAAALLTGSQVSFWDEPSGTTSLSGLLPGDTNGVFANTFTVWDELLGGDLRTPGWLGLPTADPVRLALAAADLWNGGGVRCSAGWVAGVTATGATVTRQASPPGLRCVPTGGSTGFTVTLPALTAPGADLTLDLELAPTLTGSDATGGTLVRVTLGAGTTTTQRFVVGPGATALAVTAAATAGRATRVQVAFDDPVPVTLRRAVLRAAPDLAFRRFERGAVCANPSASPAAFDLATLAPGVAYRRLRATPGQPADVNDGRPVTGPLTVAPNDAIVLAVADAG